MDKQESVKVGVVTPRIYELIGEIALKAVELEFVLAFCVKSVEGTDSFRIEDALSVRTKLLDSSEKILFELESSGFITDLPSIKDLLGRIQEALTKRDSVVHGLLIRKGDEGLKLFQFRGENWIDIDEESLQKTLDQIQCISDDTLELRTKIWKKTNPDGLIQLGLDSPAIRGEGTTLA